MGLILIRNGMDPPTESTTVGETGTVIKLTTVELLIAFANTKTCFTKFIVDIVNAK